MEQIMNKKISVVIPVYNGMNFLPRLIKCLKNQTWKNTEIIMIDDYSSDNSYEFLLKETSNDERFIVLRPDGKGGTASINIQFALNIVTGDYYFYMSQDDFIDYDCLEKCLKKAESENADIVIPNCILYYGEEKQVKQSIFPINNNYNQQLSNIEAFNLSINWKIHGFVLKKTNLFKETGFDGKYYNSDELYVRYHYFIANKICFCDTNFFYNQSNANAITKKFFYKQIDTLTTMILVFYFAKEKFLDKKSLMNIYKTIQGLYIFYSLLYTSESFLSNEKEYYKCSLMQSKCEIKKIASLFRLGKYCYISLPIKIGLKRFFRNMLHSRKK